MDSIGNYLNGLHQVLDELPRQEIEQVIDLLSLARLERRQVFILGNGGSAATASHFVCDLAKNTRFEFVPPFRVIGLADNMPIFSALANDEGYENVFAGQLANLIQPGDVVIAISASGKSPNVLKAVELANQAGARTVGMTGYDGGSLGQMVEIHLHVASDCIEYVEDAHLMLEHLITRALRQRSRAILERAQSILVGISQPANPLSLLGQALELSCGSLGATSGSLVWLGDRGDIQQTFIAYGGEIRQGIAPQIGDAMRNGLAGWVAQNRRATVILSTQDDPRWLKLDWEQAEQAQRSAVSAPIIRLDRVQGVITLVHASPGRFTSEELGLLVTIAALISRQVLAGVSG